MLDMRKSLVICVYVNTAIAVALSLYFFLIPAGELVWDLRDPGLRGEEIPRFTFRWHRALSPKYEVWARDRVRSGGAQSNTADIAGTEWPLFGSVFYLWATEALQEAVDKNPSLCPVPPNQYARGAIEAATLFALTRTPVVQAQAGAKFGLPMIVHLAVFVLLALGIYEVAASILKLKHWRREDPRRYVPSPQLQSLIWWILLGCAAVTAVAFSRWIALIFLLAALILPLQRKRQTKDAAEQNPSSNPAA